MICTPGTGEPCLIPASFKISNLPGQIVRERYACTRHVARVLRYVTIPGRAVHVERIR